MQEKLKLIWTLILLKIHTNLSLLFKKGIFDYHWTWKVYPKKNMEYFNKKYGSLINAQKCIKSTKFLNIK